MTTNDEALHEGFLGISRGELEAMNDLQLAQYQEGWKVGSARHILAEKEWQRRTSIRLMQEQFSLDTRLANATNRAMRFAALIGVIGTLAGSALGAYATFITVGGPPQPAVSASRPSSEPCQK